MDNETDFTCKIIIIGNYKSGKTSLVERYVNDNFIQNQKTTIGVDFKVKSHDYNGKIIKSYIWDTAGQERFMTIVSAYYRTINGVILVFDLNDKYSFLALETWMKELENNKNNKNKKISVMLVGNKCDLISDTTDDEKQEISNVEILNFMKTSTYPISYIKASAKTGYNVNKIFETIAENIYEYDKSTNQSDEKKIQSFDATKSFNTKKTLIVTNNNWSYINFGCW